MSKSGRYSADRKKIASIAAAEAKTVSVAECGTVFLLAGGAGTFNVTLPSIASAGKGWWAKFVLLADKASNAGTVNVASGDANTMIASVFGGLDDNSQADNVEQDATAGTITFAASAKAGDMVEIICTGEKWIAQAFSAGTDAAMTADN